VDSPTVSEAEVIEVFADGVRHKVAHAICKPSSNRCEGRGEQLSFNSFLTTRRVYVKILSIKKVISRETGGLERLGFDQFFRTAALWPV
jgi:hypothetical protein